VKAVDSRLLRHARAARGYVIFTVVLGLAVTALVLAQAGLLAHALATAARGTGAGALRPTLVLLLAVVAARALAAGAGEAVALRAAAKVKAQLRARLTSRPWPPRAWTRSTPTSPGTCRSWCSRSWYPWRCWPGSRPPTGSRPW